MVVLLSLNLSCARLGEGHLLNLTTVRSFLTLVERFAGMTRAKVQQARDLLAPVYGWFTEGFDTRWRAKLSAKLVFSAQPNRIGLAGPPIIMIVAWCGCNFHPALEVRP